MKTEIEKALKVASDYTDVKPFQKLLDDYTDQIVSLNSHRAKDVNHVAHFDFIMGLYDFMRDNVDFSFQFEELVRCELIHIMGLVGLRHPARVPLNPMVTGRSHNFVYLSGKAGLEMTDVEFIFCTSSLDFGVEMEESGANDLFRSCSQISRLIDFADRFHGIYTPEQALQVEQGDPEVGDSDSSEEEDEPDEPEQRPELKKIELNESQKEQLEQDREKVRNSEKEEDDDPSDSEDEDFGSWWGDDEDESEEEGEKPEEKPTPDDRVEADRDFEDLFGSDW